MPKIHSSECSFECVLNVNVLFSFEYEYYYKCILFRLTFTAFKLRIMLKWNYNLRSENSIDILESGNRYQQDLCIKRFDYHILYARWHEN